MRKEFYAEYFDIEDWHWWFTGRRRIFLALLDKYLPRIPEAATRRILDVGSGTGTFIQALAAYGDVLGIDADEAAVQFCRARGLTNVQLVPSPRLPFPDGSFDLLTALDVLEHIDDDRGALDEWYRVTAPGGMLLLSVPAYRFLWGRQDEISCHKRRYTAAEIRHLVHGVGFSIRRLSYFNTILFPLIANVRVFRRIMCSRGGTTSDFTMTRPGLANKWLAGLFSFEKEVVTYVDLPVGVSLLAIGHKL